MSDILTNEERKAANWEYARRPDGRWARLDGAELLALDFALARGVERLKAEAVPETAKQIELF